MYSFLRTPEDSVIDKYLQEASTYESIASMLKNLEAFAFLSDVLYEYFMIRKDMYSHIGRDKKIRDATIKDFAEKLDGIVEELMGILEFGNLRMFAEANYEAYRSAKQLKPRPSFFQMVKELKDPEIRLTIGFLFLLMKNVASVIENHEHKE